MRPETRKSLALTAASTLGYGGALWVLFNYEKTSEVFHVVSYSYLFVMPSVIGALVNRFAPPGERGTWSNVLWKPTGYVLLSLALSLVFRLEGLICVVMAAPLLVVMAAAGAFLHWRMSLLDKGPGNRGMAIIACLPIVIAPIENRVEAPAREVVTTASIAIAAPREVVWRNIIRVPEIRPEEIGFGFAKAIGFPDPVEATLSHEGLGGIRKASFKGNVVFTETIDEWVDRERLSFTIVPNTAEIPPTTLDEHVIVGGEYFKVLRGTYSIREGGDGGVILELSSTHVSITRFNFYTALWGHLVMRDIQVRILEVIRNRCENRSRA